MEFWIYCFRCCIAKFRKSLSFHFRSTADEWSHMDEKAQKEAASKDETVLFNAIGEVSVLMSQLGIEEANVKKFISKCATTCRLEESLTSSLTVFATNIVKTQKANSASLLDLKKAKIVPPEKTAERLFKFTKRTRMTHKEIIRSLIPPLSPMQSPQGSGLGSQTDSSNSKAKGGRDDEGTVTIMKSKDGKSVIKHTYADGYDLYSLEPGIERGGISCMELYKGRIVIVGTKHGVITAWDLSLLQAASTSPPSSSSSSSSSNAIPSPTHVFTAQLPWGVAVAFIRVNKEYVVACSNSGIVTVLSVTTGERLATCTPHSTPVTAVALSDGGIVATGAEDGSVCLWSAVEPQGAELKTFRGHAGPVLSLCFGKRGSGTVISGGADKTVRMWDMGTCTMVAELAGQHKAGVMFVASLSSSKIVSGSEDCAKLWNVRKKAVVVAEFPNLKAPVASYVLARGSNSDVLLALCGSGSNALLCRWEVFNDVAGALKASPPGPTLAACSLGMSGEITAVGSADGAVRLWCSLAKPPLHTFRGHTGPVVALGCTPSGMVVSASEDSSVKVWRASGDTVERWSRGSLLPPKVAVSENSEGIFRFRHSTTETSLF